MEIQGQYLTYSEYQALGGTLTETPFKILEYEARQNVDKYTYGRLKELQTQNQETKLCIFKLIGVLDSYNKQETQNKGVSSESIDGYGISYLAPSTSVIQAKNSELQGIVKEYLVDCKLADGTPYMYCGADYDS